MQHLLFQILRGHFVMDLYKIDGLIAQIRAFEPLYISTDGPVSEDRIAFVEVSLKQLFCPDYYQFVNYYGLLEIHDTAIIGIDNECFDKNFKRINDVRYMTEEVLEITDYSPPAGRSILLNDTCEWLLLMDHNDGKVYGYDVFAKKYTEMYPCLEAMIVDNLERALDRLL